MHLIHKHIVSVQTTSMVTGREIQDEIAEVFEYDLYPKLEKLLDSYGDPDRVVKFEKIHLCLKPIAKKSWKKKIVQEILQAFEKYLQSPSILKFTSPNHNTDTGVATAGTKINWQKELEPNVDEQVTDENISLHKKESDLFELFLRYLEAGVLVQNVWVNTLDQLFEHIIIEEGNQLQIAGLLLSNQNCLERWITNVPERIQFEFLKSFGEMRMPLRKEDYQAIWSTRQNEQELNQYFIRFNWIIFCNQKVNGTSKIENERILEYVQKGEEIRQAGVLFVYNEISKRDADLFQNPKQRSKSTQAKLVRNEMLKDRAMVSDTKKISLRKGGMEPLYIANAGLVILHPFLNQFFEEVELTKNKEWLGDRAVERGILLSQYLVTGREKIFEDELIFNKYLCGWPIEKNIDTKLSISKWEKAICNDLLQDVIKHWKQLKNTSVNTLQEEFIQRQGRLVLGKEVAELIVEHKSIDLLLNYLPWGIGVIKTPWMEKEMRCIWDI